MWRIMTWPFENDIGAVVPYQFPFPEVEPFLFVLSGMEVPLSVWMVRRQKKQSLAEQMRAQG